MKHIIEFNSLFKKKKNDVILCKLQITRLKFKGVWILHHEV